MITFKKLPLVKVMITQIIYQIIPISKNIKLIAIDLSKQEKPDADPKIIQQVHFTGNLDQDGNTQMFFIIEEAKETDFFKKEKLKHYNFILFYCNINIK